jgi:hypothetical protein
MARLTSATRIYRSASATDFNQSPLAPFFAFVPQLRGITIGGTGTGRVEFGGNLAKKDDQGKIVFTGEALTGSAQFSQLALQIQDTPLIATGTRSCAV